MRPIISNAALLNFRPYFSAIEALRGAGLLHRDISMGNIMISAADRRALLIDLGLAYRYPKLHEQESLENGDFARMVHDHLTVSNLSVTEGETKSDPDVEGNFAVHGI